MLWILCWILAIIVVVLCVIALWFVATLVILPFIILWHQNTNKLVNLMGRHTTNNVTRGIAEGWIFASLPIPYILILAIVAPGIGMFLIGLDMVFWLFLVAAEVIRNWGRSPDPWRNY